MNIERHKVPQENPAKNFTSLEIQKNMDSWQGPDFFPKVGRVLEEGMRKGDRELINEAQSTVELMARYSKDHDKYYLVHDAVKKLEKKQQEREKMLLVTIGTMDSFPIKVILDFSGNTSALEVGEYGQGYTTHAESYPESIRKLYKFDEGTEVQRYNGEPGDKCFFEGIRKRGKFLGISCNILEYTRSHESSDFCGGVNFTFDGPGSLLAAMTQLSYMRNFSAAEATHEIEDKISAHLKDGGKGEVVVTPELLSLEREIRERFERQVIPKFTHYLGHMELMARTQPQQITLNKSEFRTIIEDMAHKYKFYGPSNHRYIDVLTENSVDSNSLMGMGLRKNVFQHTGPNALVKWWRILFTEGAEEVYNKEVTLKIEVFAHAVKKYVDCLLSRDPSAEVGAEEKSLLQVVQDLGKTLGIKGDRIPSAIMIGTMMELNHRITEMFDTFLQTEGLSWSTPVLPFKMLCLGEKEIMSLLPDGAGFGVDVFYRNTTDEYRGVYPEDHKKYYSFRKASNLIEKSYANCKTSEVHRHVNHVVSGDDFETNTLLSSRISIPFEHLSEVLPRLIACAKT